MLMSDPISKTWQRDCTLSSRCDRTVPGGENKMPLIYMVLVLIIVGMALWLINAYIPMAGSIKTILNVVVVIAVCVWVLKAAGLWTQVLNYRI
jgi:hypothetical protein